MCVHAHSVLSTLRDLMDYPPIKFLENAVWFYTHTHEILFLHVGFEKLNYCVLIESMDRVTWQGMQVTSSNEWPVHGSQKEKIALSPTTNHKLEVGSANNLRKYGNTPNPWWDHNPVSIRISAWWDLKQKACIICIQIQSREIVR